MGTGAQFERFDGSSSTGMIGKGLYKSTDGNTFTILPSTVPAANATRDGWSAINAVAVDPTNDNRISAATKGGLQLSTDGGSTWSCAATNTIGNCIANIQDVKIADDGTVIIVTSGSVMISADGSTGSFTFVTGTETPGGERTIVKFAPSNNDTVWALSETGGHLRGLYVSGDRGSTWRLAQGPVTNIWDENSGLFGDNGQAYYDLALGVNPQDAGTAYVGGVQLWRYDGALTRIANEFGQLAFNVHSDKHDIVFDPHNPNKMLIASDGGVTVSYNQGYTYFPASKGYTTFSCYSVAFDADGKMMGGSQDNGTVEVTRDNVDFGLGTGLEGEDIRGGDGFHCDYSQMTNIGFASIYYQDFARGVDGAAMGRICTGGGVGPACDQGSFYTVGRLWENAKDDTSKDSIVFDNTNGKQAIQQGNGNDKNFDFDIHFVYDAAQLVEGSVRVYAGNQSLTDVSGLFVGDGTGTITYSGNSKGSLTVQFDNPPSSTETIWVEFETEFMAGDQVELISNTNFMPVDYTLPMNIGPGDVLKVADPVQSIFAAGMIGGVSITRNALRLDIAVDDMEWIDITSGISGTVSCIEFSTDGNHMFVGTGHFGGSTVYRVSGLNDLYSSVDIGNITVTNLGNLGGSVTGIGVDPNNPDNVVATSGNYGQSDFVWRSTNATTATGNAFTSIQGNLPEMPCFDAVIMVEKPNACVIGTDMGVFSTDDLYANPVVWTDENSTMAHTPVFAVRQQAVGYGNNRGQIYLGTHGRGMWESTAGTGIGEFSEADFTGGVDLITELTVFPNPMTTNGTISFILNKEAAATIMIYDMTGKVVKAIDAATYIQGANAVNFNVDRLGQGTYFATVESNDSRKVTKFIVM